MSAQTARLAITPAPMGRPDGPGLWRVKGMALPPYFENIRNALIRSGKTPEAAYRITWGAIRRWAHGGGKVHPEVVAAAQAALADLAAKAARAHSHSNEGGAVTATVDLAFTEALHPRVPAGGAGGGQFGSGAAGASKTAPAKGKPAKTAPAKKAAAKPAVSAAQLKANRTKAARLHAEAKADRAKAHGLLQKVSAINTQIHANQVAAAAAAKAATTKAKKAGTAAGKTVAKKAPAKAAKKSTAKAKKVTTAQLKANRTTLRSQAAGLMAKAKALDAQASHLKLASDGPAVELAAKTPAPERAAGRAKLADEGKALADGSEPIPDLAYLKKAIRSVGRLDPSKRPALKALIRKRARELNAMDEPGVKGTWAFEAANDGGGIELAMMMKTARVRGPGDVSCKRTAPGEVTVTHKPTGMRIGTLKSAQHGGWAGTHATGKPSPASGSMAGALSGLIGLHNKVAAAMPSAEPMAGVHAMAAHEAAMELAGALPYTSAATSSDGPRVTTMGGSGGATSIKTATGKTVSAAGGMSAAVQAIYRELIAKGMKPAQAMALAKRAASMHAKAA